MKRVCLRGMLAAVSTLLVAVPAAAQVASAISPLSPHCFVCAAPAGVEREAMTTPRLLVATDVYSAPGAESVIPRRAQGAVAGAFVGLIAGTVLGFVAGQQLEKPCASEGPCFRGLVGAIVGAGVGIILGAVIGYSATEEEASPAR